MNNIDTQFAFAAAELRALLGHIKPVNTKGGKHAEIIQSMIDTLDSLKADGGREVYSSYRLAAHLDITQNVVQNSDNVV